MITCIQKTFDSVADPGEGPGGPALILSPNRYAIFRPSLAKIDSKIYDVKACYLTAMTAITVLQYF